MNTSKQLISARGLAAVLGRTPQGVGDALRRLKIRPKLCLTGGNYYLPEVADKLRTAMRARTGEGKRTSIKAST